MKLPARVERVLNCRFTESLDNDWNYQSSIQNVAIKPNWNLVLFGICCVISWIAKFELFYYASRQLFVQYNLTISSIRAIYTAVPRYSHVWPACARICILKTHCIVFHDTFALILMPLCVCLRGGERGSLLSWVPVFIQILFAIIFGTAVVRDAAVNWRRSNGGGTPK